VLRVHLLTRRALLQRQQVRLLRETTHRPPLLLHFLALLRAFLRQIPPPLPVVLSNERLFLHRASVPVFVPLRSVRAPAAFFRFQPIVPREDVVFPNLSSSKLEKLLRRAVSVVVQLFVKVVVRVRFVLEKRRPVPADGGFRRRVRASTIPPSALLVLLTPS